MSHPIKSAHLDMVKTLSMLQPPRIFVNPDPEEFGAVNEYLIAIARIVDECLLAVGKDVKANASVNINLGFFTDVLRNELEGNACFEVDRAADEIRDERAA